MTIEDIILEHDNRGMTPLRPHLPPNYCDEAAQLIMGTSGPALITTGFYILAAQKPESDGPPGAIAIGRALQKLGRQVAYVTDRVGADLMQGLVGDEAEVIDFPITDVEASKRFASDLLARFNPGALISIERCSLTSNGTYLNMLGRDISSNTAKVDYLFDQHPASVGIGDGGNEIGMGNLAEYIPQIDKLPDIPAATRVTKLIVTSVSNWGGYGLVAAMSRAAGRNLLPSVDNDRALVCKTIDLGAVDGPTTQSIYAVDGYSLEVNADILSRLHSLLADEGVKN